MPPTKDAEARLREQLDTIGEANWHPWERQADTLLKAVERVREALTKRYNRHENVDCKKMSDHEALHVVKEIRRALEGEA